MKIFLKAKRIHQDLSFKKSTIIEIAISDKTISGDFPNKVIKRDKDFESLRSPISVQSLMILIIY